MSANGLNQENKSNIEDIQKLSFEDSLQKLETLVRQLESGKITLDQAVQSYETGVALKNHCESKLKEARSKVEKIVVDKNGDISSTAFDPDEN